MMIKILLTLLLPGVLPLRTKVVYKKAGEMVALHCPPRPGAEAAPSWTGPSGNLTGSLSASADVLIHGHSLVFLAVSVNHQGNYSCFPGNAGSRFWFQVVVSTAQSGEHEGSRYLTTCFTQESCRLSCPAEDIPAEDTPSITSRGVTWRREGEASSARSFFPSVEEEDGGVYVCSRSYSYGRHVYNSSFTVVLDVQPSKQQRRSEILSPKQNDVFPVDLAPSASRLHPLHLILPFGCIAALLIVLAAAVVTKSKPDAACRPRGAPGSSGGGPGPGSRLLNRAAPVEDHIC
ncbi:uncharacterized protein LOC108249358 isoform X3 [Kryptolebias marmoratus]|uniref:uncharacterized protein LOC108249358 isoform X3 n=1 Tax=Kryptolebias marmoratus TaxID=37003 RepID=UPI000D52FFCA|nr:uncharacterized protein LOC108249358 isoform X3 [Kryptolebias marmoratus]